MKRSLELINSITGSWLTLSFLDLRERKRKREKEVNWRVEERIPSRICHWLASLVDKSFSERESWIPKDETIPFRLEFNENERGKRKRNRMREKKKWRDKREIWTRIICLCTWLICSLSFFPFVKLPGTRLNHQHSNRMEKFLSRRGREREEVRKREIGREREKVKKKEIGRERERGLLFQISFNNFFYLLSSQQE